MLKTITEWKKHIESGVYKGLEPITNSARPPAMERYLSLLNGFENQFGDIRSGIFSAPGRTELSGNHTDHQHGCVLAAAVNLDMLAVSCPNGSGLVRIFSEDYGYEETDITDLNKRPEEVGSSRALVRGIAMGLKIRSFSPSGFDAYISSQVPQGSGLSSSAAFEVLIGKVFSSHFCGDALSPLDLALIGQYAENKYFGKPSGLMDQLACAVGGLLYIDFKDHKHPSYKTLHSDFSDMGYCLYITNAGGSHANLTHEYAAITNDMQTVAALFGADSLRGVDESKFYARLPALRDLVSDRAILRSMHFFEENRRVYNQFEALSQKDVSSYLRLMDESGRSSSQLLQNIFPCGDENERSISLALALSQGILRGKGAVRVHGGGFAGTILALVPTEKSEYYKAEMDRTFGKNACREISLRPVGVFALE